MSAQETQPNSIWRPKFWANASGGAALEFILVMPVFLGISGGLLEFGYDAYLRTQLNGIVSKAARDFTLESLANKRAQNSLNARVRAEITKVEPNARLAFSVESFRNYAAVEDPAEPFVDANNNGVCDAGENYEDLNGDGDYSDHSGVAGLGDADDVVVYKVTLSYDRLFGFMGAFGLNSRADYTVTRMLKIQPYSATQTVIVRSCK